MSIGFRSNNSASGSTANLRILQGWNPIFISTEESSPSSDILMDIEGETVYRKPNSYVGTSVPSAITTRYISPIESGSTGFLIENATTQIVSQGRKSNSNSYLFRNYE